MATNAERRGSTAAHGGVATLATGRHERGWPHVTVLCDPCANDYTGAGMVNGGTGRFGVYVLGGFYSSWIRGNYIEMISNGDWRWTKNSEPC
jgi:hypothetical protein